MIYYRSATQLKQSVTQDTMSKSFREKTLKDKEYYQAKSPKHGLVKTIKPSKKK